MEQQKKKKKVGVIFAICSAALVLVLGAAVYLPLVFANGNANPPHLFEKKYVSEYDLDSGETAYKVYKNWNVSKYDGRSGTQNLYVWYSGKKSTAREHLSFRVFNSSSQAKKLSRIYTRVIRTTGASRKKARTGSPDGNPTFLMHRSTLWYISKTMYSSWQNLK